MKNKIMLYRKMYSIQKRNGENYTQKDLARDLNVHLQSIWNWENNKFQPQEDYQKRIADHFKVPLSKIFIK